MNGPALLKEKDKPRKLRPQSQAKLRKACDTLMQEKGKKLFPRSILSGEPTQVMHHFVPKSVSARLRYEWDNLIPLTNGEHMRLHQSGDPEYEQRIMEIKGKGWWLRLLTLKREIIKVNVGYYKKVLEELKKL